jgi:NTE family protein
MSAPRIGLALGSGAARGWAHIGVLEALRAEGVEPEIVVGTSMGALVGAAHVTGALDKLKAFAEALTMGGMVKLLDVSLGGGFISGAAIVHLLRDLGVSAAIEDCATAFGAVATNLETGRELWLREGPIEEAVRASISIPGVFNPMRIDNSWFGDGALVNPVPVSLCRAMDADIIIAVHVNSAGLVGFQTPPPLTEPAPLSHAPEFVRNLVEQLPAPMRTQTAGFVSGLFPPPAVSPGYFNVLLNAINIMENQITRSRLAGEPPDILVTPKLDHIGPLEFHRAKEAIDEGRVSTELVLPALRRLLG